MCSDIKAVPQLTSPEAIPGEGAGRDEHAWATLLDSLRHKFEDLSQRELCRLLRVTCYADLASLVISTPYSAHLLERLKNGLTEPVWEALKQDCQKRGATLLGADHACGTLRRLEADLTQIVERRATREQLEQMDMLARQMTSLDDAGFMRCIEVLGNMHIHALIKQSGGIGAAFAARVRAAVSAQGWTFLAGDYPDEAAEPILSENASAAIVGLSALMQGQPWPDDDSDTPADLVQIEALMGIDLAKRSC